MHNSGCLLNDYMQPVLTMNCTIFPRYLDAIERAIANGDCLLLENIGESVDPVLDPLLGRITIKKGRCIKIGDKEIEYHPKFRLILQVSCNGGEFFGLGTKVC